MSLVFYVVILFYVAIYKFYATGICWRIPKSYRKGAPQYLSWSTWFAWKLFGKYCSRIIQGRRDRIKRRISCILPQNERRLLQVLFWLSVKNIGATHHWCSAEKLLWKCLRKRHEWAVNYTKYMLLFFWNVFEMFRTVISTSLSRQLHLEFSKLTTKEQRQLTHFKPVFHFYPPPWKRLLTFAAGVELEHWLKMG